MRAFLAFDERGQHHEFFALRQGQNIGNDFVGRAGFYGAAALRAVHAAQTGEEHAKEVVDFRHRAHGGAGIARGALLLQRDSGRQALDLAHGGLVHLGQELARVGREGFHVAPLAFGIDDIEGQRGLAGAGRPADDHQFIAGNVYVDVLEVVLPGFFYMDALVYVFHGL